MVKVHLAYQKDRIQGGGAVKEGIEEASKDYVVVLDVDRMPLLYMLLELANVVKNCDYDVIIFPQFFKNWNKNSITLASYV